MFSLNIRIVAVSIILGIVALALPDTTLACGGLFCQNNPVDQNAERIIFTQNNDGTVSAIIQIQYTGFDEDFSWILPIPHPIAAEDIEVPETAVAAFLEIETATNPVFIAPPSPACANRSNFNIMSDGALSGAAGERTDSEVTVFASGEVGPYGFDVVGSDDPTALLSWLRQHNYVVTEPMEPLINVYVEEKFVFLAMRLQPEFGVQDIAPIKLTYETDFPMIPIRLTAVAANPDMPVRVWIYANEQAVPSNYAHMTIPDSDIVFTNFGSANYRTLLTSTADSFEGRAFITEYAGPSADLNVVDPLLQELRSEYQYVTRLTAELSPEEMTIDPVFGYDSGREDISNVHDLSNARRAYACQQRSLGVRLAETIEYNIIWFLCAGFAGINVIGLAIMIVMMRKKKKEEANDSNNNGEAN